jgi:hypothetical protein
MFEGVLEKLLLKVFGDYVQVRAAGRTHPPLPESTSTCGDAEDTRMLTREAVALWWGV